MQRLTQGHGSQEFMVPERNWKINWSINLEDKADIEWRLENEARSWEAII